MKYKTFFVLMVVIALIQAIMALVAPIMMQVWARQNVQIDFFHILVVVSVMVVSLILNLIITFIRENFAKKFNVDNVMAMTQDFFHLKYDFINSQGAQALQNKIMDSANAIYIYLTGDAVRMWACIFTIVAVLVALFLQNWVIALILILLIPLNFLGFFAINTTLYKKSLILQSVTSEGIQECCSIMMQTDYLKQCPRFEIVSKSLRAIYDKMYACMADINKFAQVASNFIVSVNNVLQTICVLLIVYKFGIAQNDFISVLVYSLLLPLYFSNISALTNLNLNKSKFNVAKKFINDLKENLENDGNTNLNKINKVEIAIDELKIGDKVVGKNIKGEFSKGDVVWVRGKSGSGKSTLVKMLPKFREIENIKINNIELKEINNENLRALVDYLPQVPTIINGTLRENIFFNRPYNKAEEESLMADSLMQSILKNKTFDDIIDNAGANLSGGEKQKIAIARSLYSNAEVLILDEITSNIDAESVKEILQSLLKNKDKRITFIITHDQLPQGFANNEIVL